MAERIRLTFPHRIEIQLPQRQIALDTMLRWCAGKPYRLAPPTPGPGEFVNWRFANADDAEFFQATFGGVLFED